LICLGRNLAEDLNGFVEVFYSSECLISGNQRRSEVGDEYLALSITRRGHIDGFSLDLDILFDDADLSCPHEEQYQFRG
jgi:hypothetical protein